MPNILVVDDVGIIRLKLKNILQSEGFNVYESANGRTVRNNTFSSDISLTEIDLILLDIYLKDENGLNLLEYLEDNYPDIPVIVISVESKKNIVKKAINLGAAGYIAKPFDKKILLNKIYSQISEEEVIQKDSSEKSPVNDLNTLKTNLSLEINRSIRADHPFSLVKITFREVDDKKLTEVKEAITGKIRNIDQIYFTDDCEYTFLLPLTDPEGSEMFVEKILGEINENYEGDEDQIQVERISFPEIILEDEDESLNPKKQNEYQEIILENLELT